jgi:hypothetical protein
VQHSAVLRGVKHPRDRIFPVIVEEDEDGFFIDSNETFGFDRG